MMRRRHQRPPLTPIALAVLVGRDSPGVVAQETEMEPVGVVGRWEGTLQLGPKILRIVFHIQKKGAALSATMDSPDQGATGVPTGGAAFDGTRLEISVPFAQGRFEGDLREDGTILGRWLQGPADLPLTLVRRTEVDPRTLRPQTPVPPFPYASTDVRFENRAAGITLAGTLTTPEGPGPYPAAVLVSGSGPQDRNEEIFGHQPFAVLADHMTRSGIAVLRYDDRGVGQSTGDFGAATTLDFSTDTESAVAFLRDHPAIDPHRVGVVGHSEGALIAPMVGAADSLLAFIVLMAGPAVPGETILCDQSRLIMQANGARPEIIEANQGIQRALFAVLKEEEDRASAEPKLRAELEGALSRLSAEEAAGMGLTPETRESLVTQQIRSANSAWMRYFLFYDPVPALRDLRMPVLAVNGTLDLQVPAKSNLAGIQAALRSGGNRDFEIVPLEGLNHLFQQATTGAVSEYALIPMTMDIGFLELLVRWLKPRLDLNMRGPRRGVRR